MKAKNTNKGFTIVELLIVIIIIGILFAITLVSYIGMQKKAGTSVLTSDLKNASTQLALDNVSNSGYPDSEAQANGGRGLPKSLDTAYQYTKTGNSYCLSATSTKYNLAFHISSDSGGVIEEGVCSGHVAVGGGSVAAGWKQISVGYLHACGIATDDKAYCWGNDNSLGINFGVIGNGTKDRVAVPTAVSTLGVLNNLSIKSISAAGDYTTCVVASDDNAYCWGYGYNGALGNNTSSESAIPVAVDKSGALNGKTIKSISAGDDNICAIASDDNAYCWGGGSGGRLGNGTTSNSLVPVAVDKSGALNGKTIKSISAGGYSTCAIASDDNVYCWGYEGYIGNGLSGFNPVTTPVALNKSGALNGKTIKSINSGSGNRCVVTTDENIYCWGSNWGGQLGNGSTTDSSVPTIVDKSGALSGKAIKSINTSGDSACATTSEDEAYCWGNNQAGQLGINSIELKIKTATAIDKSGDLSGKKIRSISLGGNSSCVITTDGLPYCSGSVSSYEIPGLLGNNSLNGSLTFVPVSPVGTVGINLN